MMITVQSQSKGEKSPDNPPKQEKLSTSLVDLTSDSVDSTLESSILEWSVNNIVVINGSSPQSNQEKMTDESDPEETFWLIY